MATTRPKLIASPAARAAVAARSEPRASVGGRRAVAASAPPAVAASAPPAQQREKFREMQTRQREFAMMLQERWPLAFCEPPVPLAIGIHRELGKALGGNRHSSAIITALGCGPTGATILRHSRAASRAVVSTGEPPAR